jgi:multidrug efflux pump subunit AcrA (membrane-fusion protein)
MAVFRRLKAKQYSSPPTPPASTFFKSTVPSSLLTKAEAKIVDSIKDDSPLAATASQRQQENSKKKEAKAKAKDAKHAKKKAKAQAKKAKAQAKKAKAQAKKKAKAQAKQSSSVEEEEGEENAEEEEEEIDEEIYEEIADEKVERGKRRHRCTSSAYHNAEKAAMEAGMSPDTSKKIARTAYKKAAMKFDQL